MSRSWIIAIVIAVAAVAWIGSGQFGPTSETSEAAAGPAAPAAVEAPLRRVSVATIVAEPRRSIMILQGRTIADRKVEVRAELSGTIEWIGADRGDVVSEGAALVRLSVEERQVRLAEAEAMLAQRIAEHEAAVSLNAKGYRADLDLTRALAELNAAEAMVESARLSLSKTSIAAPFAGHVDERRVDVGDYLEPGDTIAVVVDLDPLRIRGQIAERELGQVARGTVSEVRFPDGRTTTGTIVFIGAVADEATRTFPVEIEVPNPDGQIIEGLTAEMRIPLEEGLAMQVSPSVLTLSEEGVIGVKAVDADGIVTFHPVRIIGADPDKVWLEGLPSPIDVIVVGADFVRPGDRVEPVRIEGGSS